MLVNGHLSQGPIRPYVPAMVEVGGLQIKPESDPLPIVSRLIHYLSCKAYLRLSKELQKWLDGASEGAIFFSFGSNARTTFLPEEKVELIMKVFSRLKQRVIMKWDSDLMDGIPKNVMIGKWLPQDDILAHKNVKVFISHCGLGSIVESKYHGVPIVGIPIFGDQEGNVNMIVKEGWAFIVDFSSLTELSLSNGINEVLKNPKYSEAAHRVSQMFRDRPMNARDTAVYWIEYVIRHRGAPHLQYPAVHLNFWQKNSIDVIAFLFAALLISVKIFALSWKLVLSKCLRVSSKNEIKKKKSI